MTQIKIGNGKWAMENRNGNGYKKQKQEMKIKKWKQDIKM